MHALSLARAPTAPPCCCLRQDYFAYIMQYSHPAGEGMAYLNELPKPLLEEVTGGCGGRVRGGGRGRECA